MPTVVIPHFAIDVPTLFAVTVFISANGGLLLLFSWLQNRSTTALALWGIGHLLGAAAAAMLVSHALVPEAWAICGGNALMCSAYGTLWAGARSFEGRRIHLSLVAAGAMIWVSAFRFTGVSDSLAARVALVSTILAVYSLLAARELWYARDRELLSRWPTLALILGHTGFLLARIPFADELTLSLTAGQTHGALASVAGFEALFTAFCLPFLRITMTKERAELEQRKAALTDSLTGIANRRAFFELGDQLLAQAAANRQSAALLLFDLDRFKEVNDTAGHPAGDRVLKAFCDLVATAMRPCDVFGRLGGEEFACVFADAPMAGALQTAERLRHDFATMRFPGLSRQITVSVGVAMAGDATGRHLRGLLVVADRALYRAKAEGRNRVAAAPPVLVARDATHRTADQDVPAAATAPLAR